MTWEWISVFQRKLLNENFGEKKSRWKKSFWRKDRWNTIKPHLNQKIPIEVYEVKKYQSETTFSSAGDKTKS